MSNMQVPKWFHHIKNGSTHLYRVRGFLNVLHGAERANSLNCAKADKSFFKNTDKTRVYSYESETKKQSWQWKTLSCHPRRCTKFKATEGWHVSLFLIKKVFCTTNTLYEVKMWKKHFYLEVLRSPWCSLP